MDAKEVAEAMKSELVCSIGDMWLAKGGGLWLAFRMVDGKPSNGAISRSVKLAYDWCKSHRTVPEEYDDGQLTS